MNSSKLREIKRHLVNLNQRFPKKNWGKALKVKSSNLNLKLISGVLILVMLIGGFGYSHHRKNAEYELATRGFNVIFGGSNVGAVRDKSEVEQIIIDIQSRLSKEYDIDVAIKEDLMFEDTHVEDKDLTSKKELEANIKATLTFNVIGYVIKVNGEEVATLKSEELAYGIIDAIKEPYIQAIEDESKIKDIKIVEDVVIVKKEVALGTIQDFDTVLDVLQKGTDETKVHIVESGENYWTIAQKYKISVSDLEKANPNKNPTRIHPGDEINLVVPKPFITVATYEEKTFIQDVKFETKYEYSASLYKNQQQTKKKGELGKSEVVAKVVKHNGIEIAKEVIKETLISQPIAQVVVKGTKELPPLKGTGSFIMPTRGTLTSRFGQRWGRMHEGIDLAAKIGTAIKAADGGTVTFAGYNGNYGYMVEIDHGSGFKTRYAHCSKIYVKKGDKVHKDQTIAAVGNTGRSTGPHLHFEVLKNGVPQDPYKYIGKEYR